MGLKMLDKGKLVGQKRGLEDEDDFDEVRPYHSTVCRSTAYHSI